MCVIIFKPKGVTVTDNTIRDCWLANSDGGGFAFAGDGKVHMKKGLMNVKDFLQAYREMEEQFGEAMDGVLHFRVRTQGPRNEEMTHPFPVNGGFMFHNGGFYGMGDDLISDTCDFSKQFGKELSREVVEAAAEGLEKEIGKHNKVVFIYADGQSVILNKDNDGWVDGLWFSNLYWRKRAIYSGRDASNPAFSSCGINDI